MFCFRIYDNDGTCSIINHHVPPGWPASTIDHDVTFLLSTVITTSAGIMDFPKPERNESPLVDSPKASLSTNFYVTVRREGTHNGPPKVTVLKVKLPRKSMRLGAEMTQVSLVPPRSKSRKQKKKATCPGGEEVSFFFVRGVINTDFTLFQGGGSSVADDMCSANYLPWGLPFPRPGFVAHTSQA